MKDAVLSIHFQIIVLGGEATSLLDVGRSMLDVHFHMNIMVWYLPLNIGKIKNIWMIGLGLYLLIGVFFPEHLRADHYPLVLTVVNNSGFDDTQIYLLCTGSNQPGDAADHHFGYINFSNHAFVETGEKTGFSLDTSTMTATLHAVKGYSGDNTYKIQIPRIVSGRLYFAFGDNFDQCPNFPSSGPPNGANNTVVYDKVEFDTWDNPNINITNVDFFGISYFVSVYDNNTGNLVHRGYLKSRDEIFEAFKNVAGDPDQQYGNTGIFGDLIITGTAGNGVEQIRILSPKNAAYTDFSGALASASQKCSHFFDKYVNDHCWRPNRQFSCYSKLYKPSDPSINNEVYYGKISSDGMTLNLYTDPDLTQPYTVATLPRPSSSDFSFPGSSQWHQIDSADSDEIDWGYLLGGQVAGTNKGAYWATDPVAMSILISIVRGVMHEDDGCAKWTDSSNFYKGNGGVSTAGFPIFYYGQLFHELAIDKLSYALSYDDIFGSDPSVYFSNPNVTLTFHSVKPGTIPCPECSDSPVRLMNVTFKSGVNCECSDAAAITIGSGVTFEKGSKVTFKAPIVKMLDGAQAEQGSTVIIRNVEQIPDLVF